MNAGVSPIWCPHVLLTFNDLLGFHIAIILIIQNTKKSDAFEFEF